MRALMIGCGKMGGAMLSRWATRDDVAFSVVDPAIAKAPAGVALFANAAELSAEPFDAIVLAVKPQMLGDIAPDYRDRLAADGALISIMAGASAATIAEAFGDAAIVRVMPNLPAQIGQGVSGLFANDRATPAQRSFAEELVKATGEAIWVDSEDALDRFTAVAGSGPGYVFEIAREYVAAARELGFEDEAARRMVLGVMAGTVALAQQSGEDLETLRDAVTSKNGTTEAGLNALRADETLGALLRATTRAAYDRAVELR